jgi:hypothetical protein
MIKATFGWKKQPSSRQGSSFCMESVGLLQKGWGKKSIKEPKEKCAFHPRK